MYTTIVNEISGEMYNTKFKSFLFENISLIHFYDKFIIYDALLQISSGTREISETFRKNNNIKHSFKETAEIKII